MDFGDPVPVSRPFPGAPSLPPRPNVDGWASCAAEVCTGVAAHVLRRWKKPQDREWFARCLSVAAAMIEDNLDTKIPLTEFPRTTVRRLKEGGTR